MVHKRKKINKRKPRISKEILDRLGEGLSLYGENMSKKKLPFGK